MINVISIYKFDLPFFPKNNKLILNTFLSELKNFFLYKKEEVFIHNFDNIIKIDFENWQIILNNFIKNNDFQFDYLEIQIYLEDYNYINNYKDLYKFIFDTFTSYSTDLFIFDIIPDINYDKNILITDLLSKNFSNFEFNSLEKFLQKTDKTNLENYLQINKNILKYILYIIFLYFLLYQNNLFSNKILSTNNNNLYIDLSQKRLKIINNISKEQIIKYKKFIDIFLLILQD